MEQQSLIAIDTGLRRIARRIETADTLIKVTGSAPKGETRFNKLVVRSQSGVQIKIEVTPVLRGSVYDAIDMSVSPKTEAMFGFAEMQVLSFEDLYAGKIMAALDRQHPRDLFDIAELFNKEGISNNLRTAIIIYLISHSRPAHELLHPNKKDISQQYEQNFMGMTLEDVTLEHLESARKQLINDIVINMPDKHKTFLRSFYRLQPKWDLLGIRGLNNLPAVSWKAINLKKLSTAQRENLINQLNKIIGPEQI